MEIVSADALLVPALCPERHLLFLCVLLCQSRPSGAGGGGGGQCHQRAHEAVRFQWVARRGPRDQDTRAMRRLTAAGRRVWSAAQLLRHARAFSRRIKIFLEALEGPRGVESVCCLHFTRRGEMPQEPPSPGQATLEFKPRSLSSLTTEPPGVHV